MGTLKLSLSCAVGLLAIICLGTGEARSQTFGFTICNNTGQTAAAATASHSEPGSAAFVIQGWFIVGPGSCRFIGNFNKGNFYYYAEVYGNPNVHWGGSDLNTCVRYPGPFEITTTGGGTCPARQLKGFYRKVIGQDTRTFTFNLND